MKANPLYRDPWARHGPCYVLDPAEWNKGNRVVKAVIPAKNPPIRPHYDAPKDPVRATETRRVVTWEQGRPLDWQIANVPVRRDEPSWAPRARELRAHGWPRRRIMKELELNSTSVYVRVMGT